MGRPDDVALLALAMGTVAGAVLLGARSLFWRNPPGRAAGLALLAAAVLLPWARASSLADVAWPVALLALALALAAAALALAVRRQHRLAGPEG